MNGLYYEDGHGCLEQWQYECVSCERSGCLSCHEFTRLSDDSGESEIFCTDCALEEVLAE